MLSRRPSPSLPQMPLRKSAVYELELKDLEVNFSSSPYLSQPRPREDHHQALANHQLITVQEKLLEGLSNCRALESVIRDSFTSIKVRRVSLLSSSRAAQMPIDSKLI
jgi:hypothetical protein